MSPPVGLMHGEADSLISGLLFVYAASTPGVRGGQNTTVILGPDSEVQPDSLLRILDEYSGQSQVKQDYVHGGPELVIEIANSSAAIDLHLKKEDYRRAGVLEYLVVLVQEQEVRWFDLPRDEKFATPKDGVWRSIVFPGLWVHGPSLLKNDGAKLLQTLQRGLESPEHAAFIRQLEGRRRGQNTRRSGSGLGLERRDGEQSR